MPTALVNRSEIGEFGGNDRLAIRTDHDPSAARQHRREIDLDTKETNGAQFRQHFAALRAACGAFEPVDGISIAARHRHLGGPILGW